MSDNQAIYGSCQNNLNIKRQSYENLINSNHLFAGEMNVDLNEFQTNLVQCPRLHFMTTLTILILTKEKAETEKNDVQQLFL